VVSTTFFGIGNAISDTSNFSIGIRTGNNFQTDIGIKYWQFSYKCH